MKRIVLKLMLCVRLVCGETVIHAPTVKGPLNPSGASSTKPVKMGASLPAACDSGELFFHTGPAAGENLYLCQPTNVWRTSAAAALVKTGDALPATCAAGELFLRTRADPARMLHTCSAIGQWTQIAYLQGTLAELPAACSTGQMYFVTDVSEAGRNLRFCTAANTWTVPASSGGASLPSEAGNVGAYLTTDGSADRGFDRRRLLGPAIVLWARADDGDGDYGRSEPDQRDFGVLPENDSQHGVFHGDHGVHSVQRQDCRLFNG